VTEVEAAAQTWRPTWRTVVQMVVGFGLSAVILIWGLPHFAKTSWGEVWAIVSRLSWRQSAGFAVLALLGLWSYTFTLTASIPGLSHLRAFIVNTAGSAVSNVLPGGGAVGLAATFAICRSWGFGKRVVSTSAIVTGVWNTLARMLLPIIAIAGLAVGSSHLPPLMRDAAAAAVVSGVVIVALFVAVIASARAAATVGQGLDRMLRPLTRRAKRSMSVEALTRDVRGRIVDTVRTGWFGLTIGLVGYFGFYYLLFWAVMKTAGVDLPLGQLFAAFAIGRLLTSVGVTPGGVGVTGSSQSRSAPCSLLPKTPATTPDDDWSAEIPVPPVSRAGSRAGDVVGEVAEPEGGASEVFEAAVEGFCWAVAGAGPVEVRQDVGGALVEGSAQPPQLGQYGRDALAESLDHCGHGCSA
jgi:uncharacterized membrane protein YbhN (UPF0104 family)